MSTEGSTASYAHAVHVSDPHINSSGTTTFSAPSGSGSTPAPPPVVRRKSELLRAEMLKAGSSLGLPALRGNAPSSSTSKESFSGSAAPAWKGGVAASSASARWWRLRIGFATARMKQAIWSQDCLDFVVCVTCQAALVLLFWHNGLTLTEILVKLGLVLVWFLFGPVVARAIGQEIEHKQRDKRARTAHGGLNKNRSGSGIMRSASTSSVTSVGGGRDEVTKRRTSFVETKADIFEVSNGQNFAGSMTTSNGQNFVGAVDGMTVLSAIRFYAP